jgi:hypothetical protein
MYNAFTKKNGKSRVERQSATKTLKPSRLLKSDYPYIHTDFKQKRASLATVIIQFLTILAWIYKESSKTTKIYSSRDADRPNSQDYGVLKTIE